MELLTFRTLFLLFFLVPLIFVCAQIPVSAQTFSKAECVSRMNKEVDAPYRLSLAKATARCNAIDTRIKLLQKQILGKWKLSYSNDDSLKGISLIFFPNGTVQRNLGARGLTKTWTIDNPYGTLGEEVIQFGDESWVSSIKIQGTTMTITSQPASFTTIERYKKIK